MLSGDSDFSCRFFSFFFDREFESESGREKIKPVQELSRARQSLFSPVDVSLSEDSLLESLLSDESLLDSLEELCRFFPFFFLSFFDFLSLFFEDSG